MQYKINEIFNSIQGEGHNAGCAAVFVRFSGCNLRCPFCDTQHEDGTMMTVEDICNEVVQYPSSIVVLTGGEPSLFVDASLCDALHALGKIITIETNGTRELNVPIDHITCSPKFEYCKGNEASVRLNHIDELKVVYTGKNDMSLYENIKADSYYLQPCDTGDREETKKIVEQTLDYVMNHPKWRLSLQLHKILNVR